jgi:hypothetical protein
VLVEHRTAPDEGGTIAATNANRFPVTLEVPIGAAGQKIEADGDALVRIDGVATWTVTLPPGGRAELGYRL